MYHGCIHGRCLLLRATSHLKVGTTTLAAGPLGSQKHEASWLLSVHPVLFAICDSATLSFFRAREHGSRLRLLFASSLMVSSLSGFVTSCQLLETRDWATATARICRHSIKLATACARICQTTHSIPFSRTILGRTGHHHLSSPKGAMTRQLL